MYIKATIIIDIGDDFIDSKDPDQVDWLMYEVLKTKNISLHSNEVGDEVGSISAFTDIKIINP